MRNFVFLFVVTCALLSACTPNAPQDIIKTAVEQTLAARATETPKPASTSTLTITPTTTFTPTATSTPTPTPTLTATPDIRILNISPDKFVLDEKDFPPEAKYYIPNAYWASFNTNEEIISSWGVEEGRNYVIETGRVTGFEISFNRGARDIRVPEELYSSIVVYRSQEGAKLTLTKYSRDKRDPTWVLVKNDAGVGDGSLVFEKHISGTGDSEIVGYILDYTYRNIGITTYGYGLKKDQSLDFMVRMAKVVLRKLMDASLSLPPTATATP